MRQIQDYIGFQLLQVHKAHRSRADAALNKLGLHTGQEMLLLQLWIEEGIPQSQLAACMEVEPPTATKMLQRGRFVSHGAGALTPLAHAGVYESFLTRRCAGSPVLLVESVALLSIIYFAVY